MARIRPRTVNRVGFAYLAALGLASVTALLYWFSQSAWVAGWLAGLSEREEGISISTVYLLDRSSWTSFDIDAPDGQVRILSNAFLPAEQTQRGHKIAPEELAYGIEYQVLGSAGAVLRQATQFLRSSVPYVRTQDRQPFSPAANLLPPHAAPATGSQLSVLDLQGLSGDADRLRLRWVKTDELTQGVSVRVHTHGRIAADKAGTEWLRLSRRQKEALAEPLLYPAELLDPADHAMLIQGHWFPVGPEGFEGSGYTSARLALHNGEDLQRWRDAALPWGVFADAQRSAVLAFAPPSGRIRVDVLPIEGSFGASPVALQLHWYRPEPGYAEAQTVWVSGERGRVFRQQASGWLRVTADRPIVLRAVDVDSNQNLTPEPGYLRTYRLQANVALDYPVVHVADEPTPLRIELRNSGTLPAPLRAQALVARYSLLDADQQLVAVGELRGHAGVSAYDSIDGNPLETWVSEAVTRYLLTDSRVTTLRLESATPLLVAVSTRPLNLPHVTQVPDDYYPWLNPDFDQPLWFVARPGRNRTEGLASQPYVLLRRQAPPPERDPAILAGDYQWQQHQPIQTGSAGYFFSPRPGGLPVRPQARSSVFYQLAANRVQSLRVLPHPNGAGIRPELYFQLPPSAQRLRLALNDQPILNDWPLAGQGIVRLPVLAPGAHQLQATAPDQGRYLLNWVAPLGTAYTRSFAHRLGAGQSLRYNLAATTTDRQLSVRVFLPAATPEADLQVELLGPPRPLNQAFSGLSIDRRRYRVRALEPQVLPSYGAAGAFVEAARVFLPIKRDRSGAAVSLELSLAGPEQAYVAVLELSPGLVETVQSSKERADETP